MGRYNRSNRAKLARRRKAAKAEKYKKTISSMTNLTYKRAKATAVHRIARQCMTGIYDFVRFDTAYSELTSQALVWTGGAKSFSLNQIAGYTEFTALFDSYQIAKVKVTFEPDIQSVNAQIGATTPLQFTVPTVYVARDLDNTVAPTTENSMAERGDVHRFPATKRFAISIVPQVGREIYRSTATTAYETPYEVIWLDNALADVPHYGLIYGITADVGNPSEIRFKYQIRVQYWVRFRAVR